MNLKDQLAEKALKNLIRGGIKNFHKAHPDSFNIKMLDSLTKRIYGRIYNLVNDIQINIVENLRKS